MPRSSARLEPPRWRFSDPVTIIYTRRLAEALQEIPREGRERRRLTPAARSSRNDRAVRVRLRASTTPLLAGPGPRRPWLLPRRPRPPYPGPDERRWPPPGCTPCRDRWTTPPGVRRAPSGHRWPAPRRAPARPGGDLPSPRRPAARTRPVDGRPPPWFAHRSPPWR